MLPLLCVPPFALLHETSVTELVTPSAEGCPTDADAVAVQLCPSVTVTVYVPAVRPDGFAPLAPPVHE